MWPFDVVLDAANNINYLIMNILYLIFYPVVVFLEDLIFLLNSVYMPLAELANTFSQTANLAAYTYNLIIPDSWPSTWTILIMAQIAIASGIRLYNFIRHVVSWIPTMGTG